MVEYDGNGGKGRKRMDVVMLGEWRVKEVWNGRECCENEKWSMWKCNDGKCMVQSTKVCE